MLRSKSGGVPRISGGNRAREEKMREDEIKEENIKDFLKSCSNQFTTSDTN